MFKKTCNCGSIIPSSKARCDRCQVGVDRRRAEYQKEYDRTERDWTYYLYKSSAWQRVRRIVLHRDNHLCQVCLDRGRVTQATTVHHIEELRENYKRRLDKDNLISLCNRHHKQIHDTYDKGLEYKEEEQRKLFKLIK